MDVRGGPQQIGIDQRAAEIADRAGRGEHGAIVRRREHHRDARGPVRVDGDAAGVDASLVEFLAHERAEQVVAHHAGDRDAHAEPSRTARQDRARASEREARLVDHALGLAERRLDVAAAQHQIGVHVAQHQEVEVRHAPTIREPAEARLRWPDGRPSHRDRARRHHPPDRRRDRERGEHRDGAGRRRRRRDHARGRPGRARATTRRGAANAAFRRSRRAMPSPRTPASSPLDGSSTPPVRSSPGTTATPSCWRRATSGRWRLPMSSGRARSRSRRSRAASTAIPQTWQRPSRLSSVAGADTAGLGGSVRAVRRADVRHLPSGRHTVRGIR